MKNLRVAGLIFAGLAAVFSAGVHAELKIGYVQGARLIEEAPQFEAASQRLKQEFAPKEEKLVSEQREIKRLEEKMARDTMVMSEAERDKMERDVMARKRELRRMEDDIRDAFKLRQDDEIAKIQQLIRGVIAAVAKEGNYDLIFHDGVAYATPAMDLTDKVLDRLRQQAKADKPAEKK